MSGTANSGAAAGTRDLAVAVDVLVEGVHFPPATAAADVGHKALAVNLSDLAALGARPLSAQIASCGSDRDPSWWEAAGAGMAALAATHGVEISLLARHLHPPPPGGAETRVLAVQVIGDLEGCAPLLRSAAQPGDDLWVSGTLGDAALGLAALRGEVTLGPEARAHALARLSRPAPRVALGLALRGLAHAAIDCSDGLAQDLGHVAAASAVAVEIEAAAIPLSAALRGAVSPERALALALAGGDDYELCFTCPPRARPALAALGATPGCPLTRIGRVLAGRGVRLIDARGAPLPVPAGYRHFSPGPGQ